MKTEQASAITRATRNVMFRFPFALGTWTLFLLPLVSVSHLFVMPRLSSTRNVDILGDDFRKSPAYSVMLGSTAVARSCQSQRLFGTFTVFYVKTYHGSRGQVLFERNASLDSGVQFTRHFVVFGRITIFLVKGTLGSLCAQWMLQSLHELISRGCLDFFCEPSYLTVRRSLSGFCRRTVGREKGAGTPGV